MTTFVQETLRHFDPPWLGDLRAYAASATALRQKAGYNTGTSGEASSVYLRCLCARFQPAVVVEIGTFIGSSAYAMQADGRVIYTCDKDNDCVMGTDRIVTHPKQTSSQMLQGLVTRRVKADLFFFDGKIQPSDVALILALSKPSTVYAFDDYIAREKGVKNVERLRPHLLRSYQFIPPPDDVMGLQDAGGIVHPNRGRSTIAVLVPA